MKFNEHNTVVLSAGYDRSVRAFDCRSQSSDPIQVFIFIVKKHMDSSIIVIVFFFLIYLVMS